MADAEPSLDFLLPEADVIEPLSEVLGGTVELRAGEPVPLHSMLLDSFDWRLYRNGTYLEREETDHEASLVWRDRRTGEILRKLPATEMRFAGDLPEGPLRDRMAKMLEMRALLPRAELRGERREILACNPEGKTVLRLQVRQCAAVSPDGTPPHPLAPQLRLVPVRGYDKHLDRVRRTLLGRLALSPAEKDLWEEALSALGRSAGDYSSKVRVPLDRTLTADAATRKILLQLLNSLEANEAGTIADLDSEFLHDFRVAVRRTRSALSQIKDVLPPAAVERFRTEFSWLGTITGPVRDLDVYLLEFPSYQAALPPPIRPHLTPLQAFLAKEQKREQVLLARRLRSRRYHTLKADWRAFLEEGAAGEDIPPENAERPVLDVARERIWKVYRRVLREGSALSADSPADRFHELRKTCKKLRYLMEFFHSLFSPAEVGALIKALKQIQDNLGIYQDLEVQASALTSFGRRMQEEGVSAECLMAMGTLVEDLTRRQGEVRVEFVSRFADFRDKQTRKRFRALFSPS